MPQGLHVFQRYCNEMCEYSFNHRSPPRIKGILIHKEHFFLRMFPENANMDHLGEISYQEHGGGGRNGQSVLNKSLKTRSLANELINTHAVYKRYSQGVSLSSFHFILLFMSCIHSPPQLHSLNTLFDFRDLSQVLCIKGEYTNGKNIGLIQQSKRGNLQLYFLK